jgi:lipopolysaccharide transport system ATP-binding protein
MSSAIKIEGLSKLYRLGTVGTGTISHDLNRWWHKVRGKEDPYAMVGHVNDRTQKSSSSSASPLASSDSGSADPDYVWALKDINLEVEQGEILGIIGRNGAGKSTLLKLLSRVTAPTTGSIKTKGRIASLLEVGTGFHPELTGRENIYLNGAILGMKRHETTKQLDAIVDFSGCAKYLDTPVKRYSSGMMVRLGFAVAAHLECEILIVDEVLAVGDFAFQQKCMAKMQGLSQEGDRTIIFVSHNMEAVAAICTSAAIIRQGTAVGAQNATSAIAEYFSETEAGDDGHSQWMRTEMSDTPTVSLVTVDTSANNTSLNIFDLGDSIEVRLCYRMCDAPADTQFSMQIRTSMGQPIFTSTTADTDLTHHSDSIRSGIVDVVVTIPSYTLNVGNYEAHFAPFLPGGRLLELAQGYRFRVVDKHASWASAPFRSPRQGIVLSRLAWSVKPSDNQNEKVTYAN